MTAASGRGYADIVEQDSQGNIISSIGFILNIMASPSVGEVSSSNEFAALSSLITQADMLFACAPTIGNVAGTASYKYWLRWSEDNNQFENTGVYAEGKDGDAYYITDIITGTAGSDVSFTDTQAILAGTSYYTDNEYGTKAGNASRVYSVADDNSVIIDGVTYYVKTQDIQSSNNQHRFYIVSVPKGDKGDKGNPGEKGDIGAPGAGGVSWVDGVVSDTERRYAANSTCFSISAISGWQYNNHQLTWTSNNNFEYNDARSYLKIGLSDSNTSAPNTYYEVVQWNTPINGSNAVSSLIFKDSVTFSPPESTVYSYFWGYQTEEAGNVKLWAVSYAPQTNFISYNASGESSLTVIDSSMKAAARTNIDAMKNVLGADGATPTNGQLIGYVESDWKAVNSEDILDELDYNDLLIITQNYAYASASAPAVVESESNSESEGE